MPLGVRRGGQRHVGSSSEKGGKKAGKEKGSMRMPERGMPRFRTDAGRKERG